MKKLAPILPMIYVLISTLLLLAVRKFFDYSILFIVGLVLVLIFVFIETWRIRRQSAMYFKNTRRIVSKFSNIHETSLKEILIGIERNKKFIRDHESSRARASQKILSAIKLNERLLSDHEGSRAREAEYRRISANKMLRQLQGHLDQTSNQFDKISEKQQSQLDTSLTEITALKKSSDAIARQISDHEGARARAAKREADLILQVIGELRHALKRLSSFEEALTGDEILNHVRTLTDKSQVRLLDELDEILFEIIDLKRHLDGDGSYELQDIIKIRSISPKLTSES